jgi:hypothetical protein
LPGTLLRVAYATDLSVMAVTEFPRLTEQNRVTRANPSKGGDAKLPG